MKHKLTEQELDTVLREALFMEEEPGEALNQKLFRRAKETEGMNKKMRKMASAVAAGLLLFTGVSVSVYAGVKFLTPQEIAENVDGIQGEAIQKAFEGENAVYVNESREFGEGTITFLGIAPGSTVEEIVKGTDAVPDRSYIILAFEGCEDPYSIGVSPFIGGLETYRYNVYTIGDNNGYTGIDKDGINYRVIECGNLEVFADRGVYLGISRQVLDAFEMAESTGKIQVKAGYENDAVLFTVPFDAGKADKEAADKIIEEIRSSIENGSSEAETAEEFPLGEWNAERVLAEGTLLENTVQTVTVDSSGMIPIPAWEADGTSCEGGSVLYDALFPDNKTGMSDMMTIFGDDTDTVLIATHTLNEDGTITFAVYKARR